MKDNKPLLTPQAMKVGGKYNWRNQPDRLVYLGRGPGRQACWHQFALVEKPDIVWCEVLGEDLRLIEETPDADRAMRAAKPYDHGPQALTVEEAARDVGKWLNERPNRPLDLRHVAMLAHHAQAAPAGWTDDQVIRFAGMILIQGNTDDSIEIRLNKFRELEGIRGNATPAAVAVQSETVAFADQSTASPVDKARRYLKAMGDQRTNSAYFFDDGYPRRESAQDALATLAVLEQLAATLTQPAPQPAAQQMEPELPDVEDMAHSAMQEALSYGLSHDVIHRWMRVVMDKTVAALATQPQEAASSQDAEDTARLDWLHETSCDLRSIDMPTGAGDSDVHWIVVEHYMAEPREREIGQSFSDDPRAAIDAARAQAKEGCSHD